MAQEELDGVFDVFKVASVVQTGAFLDCGLVKDLFVPTHEQKLKMVRGNSYVVHIFRDEETGRLTGSSKIDKFIDQARLCVQENDAVDLIIYDHTDMGYKAIINNTNGGLLYKDEVFEPLHYAQSIKGFVKKIREDGKIDLCLQKPGYQKMDELSEKILNYLKSAGPKSKLSDKTPAEEIHSLFGISKKKFKMACGLLYKQRLINIDNEGITLL
jgi:predicted RNA-binding protein (virulence factor B family)